MYLMEKEVPFFQDSFQEREKNRICRLLDTGTIEFALVSSGISFKQESR